MRGTLHLVTADDCLVLRPLAQPVLDHELARHPQYGPALLGVDLDPVLVFARALLAERPRTGAELRVAMEERFPEHDGAALAYACRNLLAFVQVPPRGVWGRTAQVASTTAESWLGRPLATNPSIDEVVLRYLAALGPATVADVATWSRLTGLREVVDRLRPLLRTFRDERGRELVDLPDAPRPDPDTPAPPRFLPEFDNALLSHADRRRFVSEEQRAPFRHRRAGSRFRAPLRVPLRHLGARTRRHRECHAGGQPRGASDETGHGRARGRGPATASLSGRRRRRPGRPLRRRRLTSRVGRGAS